MAAWKRKRRIGSQGVWTLGVGWAWPTTKRRVAVGHAHPTSCAGIAVVRPVGTLDNSPAVHCWVDDPGSWFASRRDARTQQGEPRFPPSLRDEQTHFSISDPAMNRWAIIERPSGATRPSSFRLHPSSFILPPSSFRPSSLAPRPSSRAFTLVEILVTVTIMLMLVAAAATMMHPDVEGRRIREATRQLNIYLSSARNRAMETGRPCGVILHNFGAPGFAMTLDQCEEPPDNGGEVENATIQVQLVTPGTIRATALAGSLRPDLVASGDQIQFGYQGLMYQITNVADVGGDVVLTATYDANQLVPWPLPAASLNVPYRIIRSPMGTNTTTFKSAAQPLQLPAATVVDLYASGTGNGYFGAAPFDDIAILFMPNGSVGTVYISGIANPVTDSIFLLIGKRERMSNNAVTLVAPASDNEDRWANCQDGGNLWVVINPQTGLITSESITPSAATAVGTAINQSRALAREAQGMGGR